jgi:hypothetical protein
LDVVGLEVVIAAAVFAAAQTMARRNA